MIMLGLHECLDHSWSKGYFPVVHLFPSSVLRDNSEYEFKLLAKYDFDCIAFFLIGLTLWNRDDSARFA